MGGWVGGWVTWTVEEESSMLRSEGWSLSHQVEPSVGLWRVMERTFWGGWVGRWVIRKSSLG